MNPSCRFLPFCCAFGDFVTRFVQKASRDKEQKQKDRDADKEQQEKEREVDLQVPEHVWLSGILEDAENSGLLCYLCSGSLNIDCYACDNCQYVVNVEIGCNSKYPNRIAVCNNCTVDDVIVACQQEGAEEGGDDGALEAAGPGEGRAVGRVCAVCHEGGGGAHRCHVCKNDCHGSDKGCAVDMEGEEMKVICMNCFKKRLLDAARSRCHVAPLQTPVVGSQRLLVEKFASALNA